MSTLVTPRPPETAKRCPERVTTKAFALAKSSAPKARGMCRSAGACLSDLIVAVERDTGLSETQQRDSVSAIERVAAFIGEDPARIPLDLPTISAKLATISPAAVGLTNKSFATIRSNFKRAVRASGLRPVQTFTRIPLSAVWKKLMAHLSCKRAHIGLSRFARYASADGIKPEQVDTATFEGFIAAVRQSTLHRKPNELHHRSRRFGTKR